MQVTYVGPFIEGVFLPMPDGTEVSCAPGGTIDVPDDVAAALLEQPDNWRAGSAPAAVREAAPAPDPTSQTEED